MNRLFSPSSFRLLRVFGKQQGSTKKLFLLAHENSSRFSVNIRTCASVPALSEEDSNQENIKQKSQAAKDRLKRLVKDIEVDNEEHEDEDEVFESEHDYDKNESNKSSVNPVNESVDDRLRRLSMSTAEEFIPSPGAKDARKKWKARYSALEEDYANRYPQRNNQGFGYNNSYANRNNFRRYYSTEAPRVPSSILNDDEDTFGTISLAENNVSSGIELLHTASIFEDEENDIRFRPDNGWTERKLRFKLKELSKDGKIKEAIDTLTTAHNEGGFNYNKDNMAYLYSIVISTCARVGYVKMCFKLFTDMKKRGLKPRHGIYTSLFNACANSPWAAEENVKRINRLRLNMSEKNILPNLTNCNAMIKAYGRCGDIQAAFAVVDEVKPREELTTETFNFLLQACISDHQNGFRHAVVTWTKMKSRRLKSDIYTYNLLLRAIRENNIQFLGPIGVTTDDVKQETKANPLSFIKLPPILNVQDTKAVVKLITDNDRGKFSDQSALSLMANESILEALNYSPENRLAVFGGLRGFMSLMERDRVSPDIKTMMEFVQIIDHEDFYDLMKFVENFKIHPDISFFNIMIKRYQFSQQPINVRQVLQHLTQYNLTPNVMTWGVLALNCNTWTTAKCLLKEMDEASFMPNIIIMDTFLSKAVKQFDSRYALRMMTEVKYRDIKPNSNFIDKLQTFRDSIQKGIISKEKGKKVSPPELAAAMSLDPNFEEHFIEFKKRYQTWLKNTEVNIDARDPWDEDYQKRYPSKAKRYVANEADEELMLHYSQ